jgi:hypothetical protein
MMYFLGILPGYKYPVLYKREGSEITPLIVLRPVRGPGREEALKLLKRINAIHLKPSAQN